MDECKCCQCGNDTFWYLLSGEIRCTKCLKSYPNEFEEQIATLKAEAQELHDKYGKLWDENQRQAEELKKFQAFWEQSRLTERVSFIRVYSGIKEATDESR